MNNKWFEVSGRTLNNYLVAFDKANNMNPALGIHFHLLGEFVVWSLDGNDVHVCYLIFSGELYAAIQSRLKQLVQSFLLKGGLPCIQHIDRALTVVCTHNLYAVRRHHEGGRQTDVSESYNIDHCCATPSIFLARSAGWAVFL